MSSFLRYRSYEDSKPSPSKGTTKKEDSRKSDTINKGFSTQEKREFGKLEKDIASLEKKKIGIESRFANNEIENDKINETSILLEQIISDLEQKEERWLELSMKMEG